MRSPNVGKTSVLWRGVPGYGYRRVTKALQRDGWDVNHKRVLRVMRQGSLLCQLKRRFVATTDARHGCHTYPNLLGAATLTQLDHAWVAERNLGWLARFRRLARDDDRLAHSLIGVHLVAFDILMSAKLARLLAQGA